MVYTPYPISGVVYDSYLVDSTQTTPCTDGSVRAFNVNTQEYTDWVSTNASGQYTIDLANLLSGYSNGDVIFLDVREVNGIDSGSINYRLVVDTGVGSASQDCYLLGSIAIVDHTTDIYDVICYNNSTVAGNVRFYNRANGRLIFTMNVGSNALGICPAFNSNKGIHANGGFFRTVSVKTLGNWVVWR